MKRIALVAAAAAAVLTALPVEAQGRGRVPRSDRTGGNLGSGIAGYPVIPVRDIENALFRQVSGRTAFRSRDVASALIGEAEQAHRAACSGTLQPRPHWPPGMAVEQAAQRVVCVLLARRGLQGEEAQRVLSVLREGRPGTPGDPAEQLVAALAGLSAEPPHYVDGRQRHVAGERWAAAVRAYEAFLTAAPDSLMAAPPPELLVISAVMDRAVDAGVAAADR